LSWYKIKKKPNVFILFSILEFYYYQPVAMEQFTGMPYFTPSPPPTTLFSAAESPLSNMIVRQIDYYFR